ncbi:MAG: Nucleotidase YfbR, HD superfamily [Candidatus Ozemobacter sibiricus]|uniref:5'-deoxynucleotidase n=1 Tax=Candidatus Ozemobacter sibiricus TaxID=2268124 RepID=A0A367ZMR7_9BACT|nr:MAG: Nucleotidase YfbR, HD superfamily [Candidatus Ozemobacter sibiricus]
MPRDLTALEPFFHDFLTLKKLRRTGWQLRGHRTGESLADHCFGVVLLTLTLADQITSHRIDRARAVVMATVHELAEARVGDIPYTALPYFPDKARAEDRAMTDLLRPLQEPGEAYLALFREFESGATVEARFVRAIDKLEMLLTARDYEHTGITSLGDFWTNASTFAVFAEFPELEALARHLAATRHPRYGPGGEG